MLHLGTALPAFVFACVSLYFGPGNALGQAADWVRSRDAGRRIPPHATQNTRIDTHENPI